MIKDIRSRSRLEVKVNTEVEFSDLVQWGVKDIRNDKIIRACSTRAIARRFARRSNFLRVVSRAIMTGPWVS
jgi:hypothetical protein